MRKVNALYKLLIADDEHLSRFVVKTIISKNIKDIEVIGEAENGRQAIEQNKLLRPDIIIMDIKMPGINGIDAAKSILSEYEDVQIIMLTAFDNSDYLKTAMDLGIKGYILKPVKAEEVTEKLNKAIKEIEDKSNKMSSSEEAENKIRSIKPVLESELINSLISGNINKAQNIVDFLKLEVKQGFFMLISYSQEYLKISNIKDYKIIKDKIFAVVENHLPILKKSYVTSGVGSLIVAFFPIDDGNKDGNINAEAMKIGEEIKSRIKIIKGIDTAIGIGNAYTGLDNLGKSFFEANIAYRIGYKEGKVVLFGAIKEECVISGIRYPFEHEVRIIEQIRLGNMTKTMEIINEALAYVINANYRLDYIKECLIELITMVKRTGAQLGVNFNVFFTEAVMLELIEISDIDEIKAWSKVKLVEILDVIESKAIKNREIINRAFEYINSHFTRDITLESVANDIGISPQYLSKIFKETYGTNFIDYITNKRLEYAKELLLNNRINIKDVSSAVGYGDQYYFCKIFKRDVGLTPKQFRLQKFSGELS